MKKRGGPVSVVVPPKRMAKKGPDQNRLTQFGAQYAMAPLFGWTVASLADALGSHAAGSFGLSAKLAEDMASHPYIADALAERRRVFYVCPQNVSPSETIGERRRARRCADFLREVLPVILPQATLNDLQRHEILMGQAIYGINWVCVRDGADRWWLPEVVPWDPALTGYWSGQGNPDTADGGAYMATSQSHGVLKVEPGKGRWGLIARRTLQPWLGSGVRSLGDAYVAEGYNFRDNLVHQERWGRGIIKLKYPRSYNQQEINACTAGLVEGSGGGVLQCPTDESGNQGVDAELLKYDGQGWQTFDSTEQRIIQRILVALLRQDLMTTGKTGIAANDPRMVAAWSAVMEDAGVYGDARCVSVAEDYDQRKVTVPQWIPTTGPFRRDLWRWLAYWNFGDFDLAPHVWWDATPYDQFEARQDGLAKRGKDRAAILRDVAIALEKLPPGTDAAYLLEQCGIKLTRPVED